MPTDKRRTEPRRVQGILKANGKPLVRRSTITLERRAFVDSLVGELDAQLRRHLGLVKEEIALQAKIMITEKNLAATRDHLYTMFENTDEEVPKDWKKVLAKVEFIGMRLGDACIAVLKRKSPIATEGLLEELNGGQFRFRTGHPLREIHAALMRHPDVKRDLRTDTWIYESTKDEQKRTREVIEASFGNEGDE